MNIFGCGRDRLTHRLQAIGLLNSIFVQLSVNNGMGRHLVDIPLTTLSSALKWSWAADAMSRLSIATGKVAVVLFINAIQDGVQMQWQRALLAFIAISNVRPTLLTPPPEE